MTLLLCGLGAFFVTQAVKSAFIQPLRPWLKLIVAGVASLAASALLYFHHRTNLVLYGIAGAGLAVFVHRFARLLSVAGDWMIREIIRHRSR